MVAAAAKVASSEAQTEPGEEDGYVKPSVFARRFSMSLQTVHKAIDEGDIQAITLPLKREREQRRIPMSEVRRFESGKPRS